MTKLEERAKKISKVLKEWFEMTGKTETTPEETISFLFERNVYTEGKRKDALQLRKDLRQLVKRNKLHLIEEAKYEQKNNNKKWYFIRKIREE